MIDDTRILCNTCERGAYTGRKMVLAMAYVPDQEWTEIYEGEVGLSRGTIFPELDKPFLGRGCYDGR